MKVAKPPGRIAGAGVCRLLAPVLAPSEAQARTGARYGGGLPTANGGVITYVATHALAEPSPTSCQWRHAQYPAIPSVITTIGVKRLNLQKCIRQPGRYFDMLMNGMSGAQKTPQVLVTTK